MHAEGGPPAIVCVILNWNGWQDTLACLESLAAQDYERLSVIVVDNGSTNDSVERIRSAHPWVMLVEAGVNLGFAKGCNVGIRAAYKRGADLIWLLNNDTVVPPATASSMCLAARDNPKAGMIGSALHFFHNPASVQAWGGGSVNLWTGFVSHFTAPSSFVGQTTFFTGASVMLSRRVCEEVGIFFEGFFMYSEDTDLCLRIHQAGYALTMAKNTAILHKEGASTPRRSPLIDEYTTLSTMWLLKRHAPIPGISIFLYLVLRVLNRLLRGRWQNLRGVIEGARAYFLERNRQFSDRL